MFTLLGLRIERRKDKKMNVNAISRANVYAAVERIQPVQNKATNPFLMQNATDTIELSTKKTPAAPKTKLEVAGEKFQEGLSNAGKTFEAHVNKGFAKAEEDAKKIQHPADAMATSHVAANTAFIGQAVVGTGAAIVEIAKGVFEAFKALAQH